MQLGFAAAWIGLAASEGLSQARQVPELVGRVVLGADSVGLGGVEVQLHRITPDSGGVITTRVTGADGSFRFPLTAPDSLAVFLASVRHGGVLYYGAPLHAGRLPESPYMIATYDTLLTAAPKRFPVVLRHVALTPAGEGMDVIDVLELENRDDRTWVATMSGRPVWSARLPEAARKVEVLPYGLAAGEVELRSGEVRLTGTLAPGRRQIALRYWLPAETVEWPIDDATGELEFLTQVDAGPRPTVDGLREEEARDLNGAPYRRLVGHDLPAGSLLQVRWERGRASSPAAWAWLALGLVLLVAAWAAWRRSRAGAGADDGLAPGG